MPLLCPAKRLTTPPKHGPASASTVKSPHISQHIKNRPISPPSTLKRARYTEHNVFRMHRSSITPFHENKQKPAQNHLNTIARPSVRPLSQRSLGSPPKKTPHLLQFHHSQTLKPPRSPRRLPPRLRRRLRRRAVPAAILSPRRAMRLPVAALAILLVRGRAAVRRHTAVLLPIRRLALRAGVLALARRRGRILVVAARRRGRVLARRAAGGRRRRVLRVAATGGRRRVLVVSA